MTHRLLPAPLAALVLLTPAQAQPETSLSITKIVLYKHGVGYFERQGAVTGNATVPLSFKSAEMKDVLKSLFALDLSGGRIATILYDSKDPIEKQLEDILFRVPEANALTQFLMQLKGAEVRVSVGTRAIEGRILGIEPVTRQTAQGNVVSHRLVLLRGDGALETLELLDASQIAILDETVRRDLARMMDIYAKARYADRKTVQLRTEGDGERQIRVGYIIETPIWKTSYRLLLEPGQPARLQGWAIVENRTDEDWKDVRLSFVAGSPLSFVLDLYTSYYPRRPVIALQTPSAGFDADSWNTAIGLGSKRKAPSRARRQFRVAEKSVDEEAEAMDDAGGLSMGELLEQSMAPVAQGSAVGELFEYTAQGPVSIKQGQAALVPVLFEPLDTSERCLYYRGDISPYPIHSVRLVNSTELTLESGPVTVFERGTCLGEAMLKRTTVPGMSEILPYALETGVELELRSDHAPQQTTRGVLSRGVLTLVRTEIRETRYAIRNKTAKPHTLYLDHPAAGGSYMLIEPPKPDDEVPGHLRFRVAAEAKATTELRVREQRPVETQIAVTSERPDRLRFYARQNYLSADARALLAKIAGWMTERAALQSDLASFQEERARLLADQENLRKNIGVLGDTPRERTLREQYVERLTQAMQTIDELAAKSREAEARSQQLQQQIATALEQFRDA